MKRTIAFLTALLLAVSCAFSACAQETKSITFRGVPWGTAHDEAIKQLQTDGVSFDTYAMGSQMKTVEDIIYDGIGFYNYDVSFYHRIGYQSPKFSVAGYSDAGAIVYFVYTPDDSGNFTAEEKDAVFFAAQYELDVNDVAAVREDLKAKLSSLYGEPCNEKKETLIFENTWITWKDEEGNLVVLGTQEYQETTRKVYIWYAWGEANQLLQQSNDALYAAARADEAKSFGAGNTEGL